MKKYGNIISRREGMHMMIFFTLDEKNKRVLKKVVDIFLTIAAIVIFWVLSFFH